MKARTKLNAALALQDKDLRVLRLLGLALSLVANSPIQLEVREALRKDGFNTLLKN